MKVYGASVRDIETVVADVSRRAYDGNLIIRTSADHSNRRGPRAAFTLRVLDSTAGRPGAIGNARYPGNGPNGYRRNGLSACWHAHWDVIEELFRRFPKAWVRSGLRLDNKSVVYRAATFRDMALRTAHVNLGTAYEPVTMPQCCECDHSRYSNEAPVAHNTTAVHASRDYDPDDFVGDDDIADYTPDDDDPLAYRPWDGRLPSTELFGGNGFTPTPGAAYPLDVVKPAQPWVPRVKPGSDTVGDTLSVIDDVLDEK